MIDFTAVTETWGLPASAEQLAMAYCRYKFAGDYVKGKRVLEIGCGTGMGLQYLMQRGAGFIVAGDYTKALLLQAQAHNPGAMLVRLEAEHLPFAGESFDVVLMLEMLYYVRHLADALKETKRVLAPGGLVIVSLPNRHRPAFNPSPFSTYYPDTAELAHAFKGIGFSVRIFGGFPVEAATARDQVFDRLRKVAIRYNLIPKTMRGKALLKRLLYRRLSPLGPIHDAMAAYPALVELSPDSQANGFKNIYVVAQLPNPHPTGLQSDSRTMAPLATE